MSHGLGQESGQVRLPRFFAGPNLVGRAQPTRVGLGSHFGSMIRSEADDATAHFDAKVIGSSRIMGLLRESVPAVGEAHFSSSVRGFRMAAVDFADFSEESGFPNRK